VSYRVRTSEGELDFASLAELQQAYGGGLVAPEDEVLDAGTWRSARSVAALAGVQRKRRGSRLSQWGFTLAAVALGIAALVLLSRPGWGARGAGLTLALVVSSLLTRVTYKAYRGGKVSR